MTSGGNRLSLLSEMAVAPLRVSALASGGSGAGGGGAGGMKQLSLPLHRVNLPRETQVLLHARGIQTAAQLLLMTEVELREKLDMSVRACACVCVRVLYMAQHAHFYTPRSVFCFFECARVGVRIRLLTVREREICCVCTYRDDVFVCVCAVIMIC